MTGSMIDPDKTEITTAATLERFVGQDGKEWPWATDANSCWNHSSSVLCIALAMLLAVEFIAK